MKIFEIFLIASATILTAVTLLWVLSLILKNASVVDIFWGLGFILAVGVIWIITPLGNPTRKILIVFLVTVWGLRLSFYIFKRNWKKPEDFRYAKWRADNGAHWWWISFFKVFLLQGILLAVIATPLLFSQAQTLPPAGWIDWLGVFIWTIGFLFEALGDWQMMRFKSQPQNKGKIMTRGLWAYTRHPNYFGEAVLWWGYYLIAVSAGLWWTIYSPMIMTFLLVRVSGVSMLEEAMSKREGYVEYMRKTNAFIPWMPKK